MRRPASTLGKRQHHHHPIQSGSSQRPGSERREWKRDLNRAPLCAWQGHVGWQVGAATVDEEKSLREQASRDRCVLIWDWFRFQHARPTGQSSTLSGFEGGTLRPCSIGSCRLLRSCPRAACAHRLAGCVVIDGCHRDAARWAAIWLLPQQRQLSSMGQRPRTTRAVVALASCLAVRGRGGFIDSRGWII